MLAGVVPLLTLLASPAHADLVTIHFSGTISTVDDLDHHLLVPINLGDTFTGKVQYDPATPGGPFPPGTLDLYTATSPYVSSFYADINGVRGLSRRHRP